MVAVDKVANVIMVEFVCFKVAGRIDSLTLQIIDSFEVAHLIEVVKLQNLFMMNLRSGRFE